MKAALNGEFLKKLDRVYFSLNSLSNNISQGARKSNLLGSSVEFSDYREYVRGDDIKRLDWNAYGRFDKLFIKLFMEEREAEINLFIDSSASMDFGENKKSKFAVELCEAISYIFLKGMDRVTINDIHNDNLIEYPSINSKSGYLRCVENLEKIDFSGGGGLFKAIKAKKFKRGFSVLISDFLTGENLEDVIKLLKYNKQKIVLIQVLSIEEVSPSIKGFAKLIDSESGRERRVSLNRQILTNYEKKLKEYQDRIREMSFKWGCFYTSINSDESLEKVLFEDLIKDGIIRI